MTKPQTSTWSAREECWKHRHRYFWSCGIALILAVISYLITPTEYVAQTKISDEYLETDILLGLNRTAALIKKSLPSDNDEGLNNPEVYAQILSSRSFCEELSKVAVNDSTDYYHYLVTNMKLSWYDWLIRLVQDEEEHEYILDCIQARLKYSISPKYYTVLIQVEDQQAHIAQLMVDSTSIHLQRAITKYRMQKKEQELIAAEIIKKDAETNYQQALLNYSSYADANSKAIDQHTKSKIKSLEEKAEIAKENYNEQMIAFSRTQAQFHQSAPSFTTLINSTTPQKPTSPLLIVNILLYTFLAFVFTSWYTLYQRSYRKGVRV